MNETFSEETVKKNHSIIINNINFMIDIFENGEDIFYSSD